MPVRPQRPQSAWSGCLQGVFALFAFLALLVILVLSGLAGLVSVISAYLLPHPGTVVEGEGPSQASFPLLPRRGDTPSLGTNNLLAILVNYSDTRPTFTPQDFEILLFGKGNKSMADYFAEASHGRLTLRPGPAGVLGWYTIAMTHAQAVADPNRMAFEAIRQADRDGVDFAAYDMDGDCDADTVAIIHQVQSGAENVGTYAGNIGSYGPYETRSLCVKGGFVTVYNYITVAERSGDRLVGVGSFVHEYGHVLGLPELYDTDGSSFGSGVWSSMASGSFNGVVHGGDTPALYDPWSRFALNWLTPIVIERGAPPVTVTLPPASESPSVVLFGSGAPSSEYFLVENRQRTGFDAGLPGTGLLVWHIDDAVFMNNDECAPRLPGECASRHYKVALVQADGRWDLEDNDTAGLGNTTRNSGDNGDPFPGINGVTSITDDTHPSVRLYSGQRSGIRITSITREGINISAVMSMQ